jgi:hypothetical protein
MHAGGHLRSPPDSGGGAPTLMVLTVSACTACENAPPTTPVATSPSTARRPATASPSAADALIAARALPTRRLGSTPCDRPVMDAMACAISASLRTLAALFLPFATLACRAVSCLSGSVAYERRTCSRCRLHRRRDLI